MLKVFEYMNAADLPITEIDENAILAMYGKLTIFRCIIR